MFWVKKSLFFWSPRKFGEIFFGPRAGLVGIPFFIMKSSLSIGGKGVPALQTKLVVIVVIDRLLWINRGIMWVGASPCLTAGSIHCLRSCGNSAGGRDLLVRQKYQPGRLNNITLARIKTLPRNNEPTSPPRIKCKTFAISSVF